MNEVINGLYGFVYDENGKELSTTQEFEATVEFEKESIRVPGKFMASQKVMGGEGSGSMMFLKVDSRLQRKIAENPVGKYNYISKLKDPTSRGEEAVMLIGVSFDSVPIAGHSVGELVEVELDFTFDNYKYLKSIN
jgi:hypothetical protein